MSSRHNAYRCPECPKSFKTESDFRRHHFKFHGPNKVRIYKCPHCTYADYVVFSIMKDHMNMFHKVKVDIIEEFDSIKKTYYTEPQGSELVSHLICEEVKFIEPVSDNCNDLPEIDPKLRAEAPAYGDPSFDTYFAEELKFLQKSFANMDYPESFPYNFDYSEDNNSSSPANRYF